ncbi:phage tail tape measure protein [Criibacterium bergeronii]|uniref:Phage tail tape measure protein n=1 Tax=Criibacterium bergeronii TaxID=1871336 RepID=A0A371IJP1_9FIRM|nr:phage tail tape measure protein [Criibacterium bergeronii]RDY20707.1 phage tail tape measure protein [Criibacterium bergeronii]
MAGNIKGITIEIGGNTTKLEKALKGVNKTSRDLNNELKSINKSLKFNPGNSDLIAQKQRVLGEQIQNTKKKIDALKIAYKQAQDQLAKGNISQSEFDALTRDIITAENQLKSFSKELSNISQNSAKLNVINKDLDEIGKSSDKTKNELKQINEALKLDPKNVELAAQKQAVLGDATEQTRKKLDLLKQKQEETKKAFENGEIGADNYRAINRDIETTTKELKDLQKELDKSKSKFEEFGNSATGVGEKFKSAGDKMKPISAAAAGVSVGAVKMATDFEDSFAKVETIADTTNTSLEDLKDGVLALSKETGQSASDLNEGLYQAISGSVDTAEAVNFLGVATKAARGGFTDAETAVNGLTTVLNSYGMASSEAEKIANQMLITQNQGKTSFGELAGSIGKITPLAAALGVSTDELFSSLAVTTAQGLATSESVSGLKAAMSNVIKPTKEASETAEALGLDFSASAIKAKGWMGFLGDMRTKLEQAAPAYVELFNKQVQVTTQMSELEKAGKKGSDEYKALNSTFKEIDAQMKSLEGATDSQVGAFATMFGSVEGLNAMLMLTSDTGLNKYNLTMQDMQTNTTALDDAFKKMNDTPGQKMKKSLNDVKNAGIKLGQDLLPVVISVSEAISGLADWFSNLSPETQDFIAKFILITAAVSPVLLALGGLITTIGAISTAIGSVIAGFSAAGGASGVLAGALTFLSGPIGAAIAIIGGLVAVGVILYKNWDTIKEKASQAGEFIKGAWNSAGKSICDGWDNLKAGASEKWGSIQKSVGGFITNMKNDATSKFNDIATKAGNAFENTKKSIRDKISDAKKLVSDGLDKIKGFFGNLKLPEIKLPKIKLPHFSFTGGFSINPPSVPKFNINWHKDGGIFTSPTIFAGAKGFHGVGEAGAEAILPLSKLKDFIHSGDTFISININNTSVRNDDDITKIVEQVKKAIKEEMQRAKRGRGLVGV